MILVDTSVWIDHFRRGNQFLVALLDTRDVLVHPFVVGELALGYLRSRDTIVSQLQLLPQANIATPDEVLKLVERRRLFGRGIGYVDVHLLAAVLLTAGTTLWTNDDNLQRAARDLGVFHVPRTG